MKPSVIPALALLLAVSHLSLLPAAYGQAPAPSATTSQQAPAFLKVGEWYVVLYFGEEGRGVPVHFKVVEDAGGGWVKVEHKDGPGWLNTNAARMIKPGTKD